MDTEISAMWVTVPPQLKDSKILLYAVILPKANCSYIVTNENKPDEDADAGVLWDV